ncbi:hypothetical protein IQ07DRAFT_2544 [Pyrenochaeta sp. DS3sAY3a]|nr:hypothetical protein IQ07DRAFT_2544 [Pyrenochaeta sp. DS3sAY3a]
MLWMIMTSRGKPQCDRGTKEGRKVGGAHRRRPKTRNSKTRHNRLPQKSASKLIHRHNFQRISKTSIMQRTRCWMVLVCQTQEESGTHACGRTHVRVLSYDIQRSLTPHASQRQLWLPHISPPGPLHSNASDDAATALPSVQPISGMQY